MSQTLGQRIRQARKASGMTQDQLAQGVPVSRQTVSSWENDRTQPDYETLQKIAVLLGIEIAQLFQAEEKTQEETVEIQEVLPAESVEQQSTEEAAVALEQPAVPFRLSRRMVAMIAAAALLLAAGMLCLWHMLPKVKAPALEWFQSEQQRVADACCIELSTTETPVIAYSYPPGSPPRYTFRVTLLETGGVGYTIQRIGLTYFHHEWFGRTIAVSEDEITPWQIQHNMGGQYVGANQVRLLNLNIVGDKRMAGAGIMVDVIDDNGKQQVFHIYVPFQQL